METKQDYYAYLHFCLNTNTNNFSASINTDTNTNTRHIPNMHTVTAVHDGAPGLQSSGLVYWFY